MNSSEERWRRLVSAARGSTTQVPEAGPVPDRDEIARLMRSLRGTLRGMFLTLLWRRWALALAVIGTIAYIAAWFLATGGPGESPVRPEIPLPIPP